MVEVVQKTTESSLIGNPFSIVGDIAQYWGYIVLAIVLIILTIVIWQILAKWEDERKERDDPVYEGYKNLIRDCDQGKDKTRIRKNYRLINIFWFGLPFAKSEHSAKIVNYTNEFLGFYRGHSYSQDGYFNILAYKEKVFLFFEKTFLIRCPYYLTITVKKKGKDGKYLKDEDGKFIPEKKKIDYKDWVGELKNGDIKILCTSLQKLSYFRYPVYLDENKKIVDLRKQEKEDIIDLGHDQMLARVLATGSQMVEKAMLHNPNVQYEQKIPEKTKTEQSTD